MTACPILTEKHIQLLTIQSLSLITIGPSLSFLNRTFSDFAQRTCTRKQAAVVPRKLDVAVSTLAGIVTEVPMLRLVISNFAG